MRRASWEYEGEIAMKILVQDERRDFSFDALRGIAIIGVVAIHALNYGVSGDNSELGRWNFYFICAARQFVAFAVPVFLFISGYWNANISFNSITDYFNFIKRRLIKVILPYLFWSLLFILTTETSIKDLTYKLLTGTASGPYYFIILIVQLYLLMPLFQYINRKRFWGLAIITYLNLISLLFLYFARFVFKVNIGFPYYALPFFMWFAYFELGLILGKNSFEIIKSFIKWKWIVLLFISVSLCASLLETAFIIEQTGVILYANTTVKFTSFFYSIAIVLGFFILRHFVQRWPKALVILGKYSFGIYLIHMIFLPFVVKLFRYRLFKSLFSFQPLFQIIVITTTVVICCIFIAICHRYIPRIVYKNMLGFGT